MNKIFTMILASLFLCAVFTTVAFAAGDSSSTGSSSSTTDPSQNGSSSGGIMSKITSASTDDIVKEADNLTNTVVTFVRSLAVFAAVLFFIWSAIILVTGGRDGHALASAKLQIILFIVALFIIINTETLVGSVLKIMGYSFK
ncbi:MAG: hypothetical protein ACYCX4_03540 [Bacillota bacterium]